MGGETVFEKFDENGRLIEKWGNERTFDNDVNFRKKFFYDEDGKVIRSLYYTFQDSNPHCSRCSFRSSRAVDSAGL